MRFLFAFACADKDFVNPIAAQEIPGFTNLYGVNFDLEKANWFFSAEVYREKTFNLAFL